MSQELDSCSSNPKKLWQTELDTLLSGFRETERYTKRVSRLKNDYVALIGSQNLPNDLKRLVEDARKYLETGRKQIFDFLNITEEEVFAVVYVELVYRRSLRNI